MLDRPSRGKAKVAYFNSPQDVKTFLIKQYAWCKDNPAEEMTLWQSKNPRETFLVSRVDGYNKWEIIKYTKGLGVDSDVSKVSCINGFASGCDIQSWVESPNNQMYIEHRSKSVRFNPEVEVFKPVKKVHFNAEVETFQLDEETLKSKNPAPQLSSIPNGFEHTAKEDRKFGNSSELKDWRVEKASLDDVLFELFAGAKVDVIPTEKINDNPCLKSCWLVKAEGKMFFLKNWVPEEAESKPEWVMKEIKRKDERERRMSEWEKCEEWAQQLKKRLDELDEDLEQQQRGQRIKYASYGLLGTGAVAGFWAYLSSPRARQSVDTNVERLFNPVARSVGSFFSPLLSRFGFQS